MGADEASTLKRDSMSLRFRRSLGIAPGVRPNLGLH